VSVPKTVEFAGGRSIEELRSHRDAVLARAPAWVREQVRRQSANPAPRPPRVTARPSAPKAAARRFAGWLAGCACPGISVRAFSTRDGLSLREQFTDRCVAGWVDQWRRGNDVRITWRHGGPVLASRALDVTLRQNALLGLMFSARLEQSDLAALALEQLERNGLAVSVGYFSATAKQWHVKRDGFGTVRIIDECQLDHIAILPATSGADPAYRGARAFGVTGRQVGCPSLVRTRAELYAYSVVKEQAYELVGKRTKAALK
jgi:hypothetical protein